MVFNNIYKDKTVVVTGHTGFKGGWLISWLRILGARVVGISLDPSTQPTLFHIVDKDHLSHDYRVDIRNLKELEKILTECKPDFIFHLAAQALVKNSYFDPVNTWTTNVMGTVNLLESMRSLENPCIGILITSDKCYENLEWAWGYRETDRLGGIDPYSASKAAAEIAISSYVRSFFQDSLIKIVSVRAGNVIGGGDWSPERIVPDCVKSWSKGESVSLRNPFSTRPWQHVLEPLGGYLLLGSQLAIRPELHGESFNFGPPAQQDRSVLDLVKEMSKYWTDVRWQNISEKNLNEHEAGLLKLSCDKVLNLLDWRAAMVFEQTVELTSQWYKDFYQKDVPMSEVMQLQIKKYIAIAASQNIAWAQQS
jgi:CDP-glucose 4,6-dehydratase